MSLKKKSTFVVLWLLGISMMRSTFCLFRILSCSQSTFTRPTKRRYESTSKRTTIGIMHINLKMIVQSKWTKIRSGFFSFLLLNGIWVYSLSTCCKRCYSILLRWEARNIRSKLHGQNWDYNTKGVGESRGIYGHQSPTI